MAHARNSRPTRGRSHAVALSIGLCLVFGLAGSTRAHEVKDVSADAVATPGALAEISLGNSSAKITIVEYVSLTCARCADFHIGVLPQLKSKYIDTGLVRLVIREFPLDRLAAATAMLTRCSGGPEQSYAMIGEFLSRQAEWVVRTGDAVPKLFAFASRLGFDESKFAACLNDQVLFDKIVAVRNRAAKEFGVQSTPTFFVNGKGLEGGRSIEDFDKLIEPILR